MSRVIGRISMFTAALLVILVAPARGELRQDWSAWLGCWQPMGVAAQENIVLCMLPGEDAQSVRMLTIAANTLREQNVLRPDGVGRPVTDGGCSGLETATWSADHRRVFIRSELECGSIDRTATSVLAFVASDEFIDAQAITVNGQHAGRSVRYRALPADQIPAIAASELAGDRTLIAETARLDAFLPLDVDDVVEAAGRVAPPALEALLAARNHGFALDSRALRRLEGEGIPRSVMNVMIALSYPDHFNVQADAAVEVERAQRYSDRDDWHQCYDSFYRIWRYGSDCYLSDPFYFDRYRYGSRYGYGFGGGYSNPWSPTPVVVIVRGEEEQLGEVIKGQGYTNGSSGATGAARPRSATSSAGSSSGSSGSSSGASSSGSSGSSTGRTAVRRGGGETPPPTPPPAEQAQRYQPAPIQAPPPAPRVDPPPVPRVDPPANPPATPPEPPRTAVRKPGGN